MIEKDRVYNLMSSLKGWPVEAAQSVEEAGQMILGSPYWDIPPDLYRVIDQNDVYCLMAVYRNGKTSLYKRYLALNMKLEERAVPA